MDFYMSARFPFPTKLNPLWWLKNELDPVPPAEYMVGSPTWKRRLYWWCRNPFHNFMWFVLGCEDRKHLTLVLIKDRLHFLFQAWPPFICPYVCYDSPKFFFYLGWRLGGAFGARITLP